MTLFMVMWSNKKGVALLLLTISLYKNLKNTCHLGNSFSWYTIDYLTSHLNFIGTPQEIIKVRGWIPRIGPLAKVIRLKLFLDIVPSSFADITRALRGCFRGGSVYVLFRFVLKQSKTSNSVKMSSLITGKELRLSVCWNTFRILMRV